MLTLTFLLYFCSIFKGNTTDRYCNFFPSNVSQFLKEKKLKYTFYLTLMLRQLFYVFAVKLSINHKFLIMSIEPVVWGYNNVNFFLIEL